MSALPPPARPASWKWMVCGLLLLATMLNYMDRMTLNQLGPRIMRELELTPAQYGRIESAFALAFASGALVFGWLADRINIRWLYPAAVLAWSAAGFATGFASTFAHLILFRFLLGLAEAGNWPCALRTTQRILPPDQRPMGNSLLQSGAALGAVLTPLVIIGMVHWTGSWRPPFWIIGSMGVGWVVLWVLLVRQEDLALPVASARATGWDRPSSLQVRRFIVLIILVVTINISWHYFRAWLPLFLTREVGYEEQEMQLFMMAYYIATDVGTLTAGAAALLLARSRVGLGVHNSRLVVFLVCCGFVSLSVLAAQQEKGYLLLGLLLVIGFGALGLFPIYYSFSQELTTRHQGKVTGTLGCSCWLAMAALHEIVGQHVQATQSYRQAVAVAGLVPWVGFAALVLLWGRSPEPRQQEDGSLPYGERSARN